MPYVTYPYCTAGFDAGPPCRQKSVIDWTWFAGEPESYCVEHARFMKETATGLVQMYNDGVPT